VSFLGEYNDNSGGFVKCLGYSSCKAGDGKKEYRRKALVGLIRKIKKYIANNEFKLEKIIM